MGFIAEALAGDKLVRAAIQSPNFISGQSGWTINRDGTAEFNNVTARGTIIASEFRSTNFVEGVSGFDLNASTNTVEINSGFRIGGTAFGSAGGQHIEIGLNGGLSQITMYTGNIAETLPASLETGVLSGFPVTEWDSPTTTNGHTFVTVSGSTLAAAGGLVIGSTGAAVAGSVAGAMILNTNMQTVLTNTDATAGGNNALIVGTAAGTSLRLSGSEIQAVAAGPVVSTLKLNPSGGTVIAPGTIISGSTAGANVNMNFNQVWALNNGAAATLFLQFSSAGMVQIGDGTATGAGLSIPSMSPVTGLVAAGAANTGSAFALIATGFTFIVPPSGVVIVNLSARITLANTIASGQRGLVAFQLRANNAAGAITHSAQDSEALEAYAVASTSGIVYSFGRSIEVAGLTPGSTQYIEILSRTTNGAGTTTVTPTNINIQIAPAY